MAGVTGLEPATSGVTGRRSNQLSYTPTQQVEGLIRSSGGSVKRSKSQKVASLDKFFKHSPLRRKKAPRASGLPKTKTPA